MMSQKEFLGVRIKRLRESKELNQEHLAEKMDISINNLSSIEREKESPAFDMRANLSTCLKVEMWKLFDFGHEVAITEVKEILTMDNSCILIPLSVKYGTIAG